MDDEFQEAIQLDDEARQDFERWEWQRAQSQPQQDMVFKTFTTPPPPEPFTEVQMEIIAQFVSDYLFKKVKALETKFDIELAAVRADLEITSKIQRGEIASIKGTKGNAVA